MSFEGKQIDRYHILHLLGSGGMGDVYLAEDPRIGQQVAIKVIRIEVAPYPHEGSAKDAERLFQREAKAIVRLDHPHILPLYDYGEEHIANISLIYLVMPYRPEGSLSDWLRKRETKELLSPQDVASIISQAADALQHAHDHHVIHQDVKPSNFLVRAHKNASTRPDLLLSDFGIARLSSATSSVSQSVRGTPSYMAPEQWEGEPTPATDQYALAVMAYELLTGKLPFHGGPSQMLYQHLHVSPQPPSTLNSGLSKDIDEVIIHALAKQPQQRFSSIGAFGNAFRQAVEGVPKVQTMPLPNQPETTTTLVAGDKPELAVPTLLASTMQVVGSDSETFVKPENIPSSSPLPAAITLTQQAGVREVVSPSQHAGSKNEDQHAHPLTSTVTPPARPRKSKKRALALITLVALVAALIGGGIVYALPALTGRSASNHTTSRHSSSTNSIASASVSLVPTLKTLQNTFSIEAVTGTPDKSKHQYQGARFLSTTTSSYTQTAAATGQGTIPGTHASGTVCIDNFNTAAPLTLQAGSVYGNTYPNAPFFHMVLDATESLPPAPSSTQWSQVCGPAHVQEVGTIGNNIFNNNQYGTLTYSVFTNSALEFTNGKDPKNYVALQQSDIDNAAHALEQANAPDPQQIFQAQVQANQRYISSPQCTPNVSADHAAGDAVTSVTVTVTFTCTGEVYDSNGAQSMASQLLHDQATANLGSSYLQVGNIATTVTKATLTDAQQGTITLAVTAQGKWLYQFTAAQKQALAKLIAGKKHSEAQTLLLSQPGVAQAAVQVSGGDGQTLPADINKITITIQNSSS